MLSTKSGKELQKRGLKPRPDEKILLESPGGILTSESGRWQMGSWCATDRSLVFSKGKLLIWTCMYKMINALECEKRPFAFGSKDALCIKYGSKQRPQAAWLVVTDLHVWHNFIRIRAFPQPLTEELVCKVASEMDGLGEQLLWHFWERRHATIDELIALGVADDPMEIIRKIKEVINPLAEELIGFPLFVFCEEKVDAATKKAVKNSWWLVDPLCDL